MEIQVDKEGCRIDIDATKQFVGWHYPERAPSEIDCRLLWFLLQVEPWVKENKHVLATIGADENILEGCTSMKNKWFAYLVVTICRSLEATAESLFSEVQVPYVSEILRSQLCLNKHTLALTETAWCSVIQEFREWCTRNHPYPEPEQIHIVE
ncbi:hypothetical protein GNI_114040 [Gregarina niphandrodes]|uniref:Uncharacterized protein n=1 Tax=Gregarina niphandrodes TaxID=110365 RepID=A0A023B354_GRENI|nr:hypothetical protein GNI_114040 [Gregarina niphandrodes]EZG55361.1 hypothetical protein GNI_114040 [Gregarina niphandrodes]|eukprot:XP_011131608.1 hypothetical protein GNI_114040 [Gregarina niphandrodes]